MWMCVAIFNLTSQDVKLRKRGCGNSQNLLSVFVDVLGCVGCVLVGGGDIVIGFY